MGQQRAAAAAEEQRLAREACDWGAARAEADRQRRSQAGERARLVVYAADNQTLATIAGMLTPDPKLKRKVSKEDLFEWNRRHIKSLRPNSKLQAGTMIRVTADDDPSSGEESHCCTHHTASHLSTTMNNNERLPRPVRARAPRAAGGGGGGARTPVPAVIGSGGGGAPAHHGAAAARSTIRPRSLFPGCRRQHSM